jgi:hypothetical protein
MHPFAGAKPPPRSITEIHDEPAREYATFAIRDDAERRKRCEYRNGPDL